MCLKNQRATTHSREFRKPWTWGQKAVSKTNAQSSGSGGASETRVLG